MSGPIRGHNNTLKVFKNGKELGIVNLTKWDVNQDSTFSRSFYVGQSVPEGDQSFEGWSGSFDAEVKDSAIDDMIDELVTDNQNGVGVADYSLVHSELYLDGTGTTHVYYNCQFKMGKSVGGLNEKVTKKLDFQASGRLPL